MNKYMIFYIFLMIQGASTSPQTTPSQYECAEDEYSIPITSTISSKKKKINYCHRCSAAVAACSSCNVSSGNASTYKVVCHSCQQEYQLHEGMCQQKGSAAPIWITAVVLGVVVVVVGAIFAIVFYRKKCNMEPKCKPPNTLPKLDASVKLSTPNNYVIEPSKNQSKVKHSPLVEEVLVYVNKGKLNGKKAGNSPVTNHQSNHAFQNDNQSEKLQKRNNKKINIERIDEDIYANAEEADKYKY